MIDRKLNVIIINPVNTLPLKTLPCVYWALDVCVAETYYFLLFTLHYLTIIIFFLQKMQVIFYFPRMSFLFQLFEIFNK